MLANWTVWPFVTYANLRFVPRMYQVLVVNFFALFWNFYLANQNSKNKKLALVKVSP